MPTDPDIPTPSPIEALIQRLRSAERDIAVTARMEGRGVDLDLARHHVGMAVAALGRAVVVAGDCDDVGVTPSHPPGRMGG